MRKSLFLVLAAALASTCAFAVDGVVLINQSTVTAAGGFPYTITQPGSYKLSGNLTPPLNVTAIQISTGNVSLDLNGFTISCSFTPPSAVACVTAENPFFTAAFRKIAIRNGAIDVSQAGGQIQINEPTGILVFGVNNVIVEELQVEVHVSGASPLGNLPSPLNLDGVNAIVRHNILRADNTGFLVLGATMIACPSLIVENVLNLATIGSTCVTGNNVAAN